MLTTRSSFIVATSVFMLFMGLIQAHEPITLVALSLLIWVLFEWICFQQLMFTSRRALSDCVRLIDGQKDANVTLVTDRIYQVQLRGLLPSRTSGYRVTINDMVPNTFSVVSGRTFGVIDSSGKKWFSLDYEIQTPICGKMAFPGLRVELNDHWGFFRTEQFVSVVQKPTVLPFLIRPQTTVSVLKHNNLQRHIGHHRHKSAGVSSELLGIRDYRVGDPPRTIAWKPTARLGKVMTCEFENEVPIRATIIVDLATYQFQGRPGPSPADRAILGTAAIAKLLLADRDPVAAILLRDDSAMRVGHGSGERHLTTLLQYLLAASNPNPSMDHLELERLVQVVFENCSRRFPNLFDEQFNSGRIRGRLFSIKLSKQDRERRALAIVLEHLLELEPGMSTRMQYNDQVMGEMCMQYVDRYLVVSDATSVALDPPWIDPSRWRAACHRTTQSLCDNLIDAKTRANDNELFVLVAPEPLDYIGVERVETAVKSVVAANHRVVFVAPSIAAQNNIIHDADAARILAKVDQSDLVHADSELKWRLNSLGAEFSRLEDPKLMQIVAMQIGLLQSGSRRGSVQRSRR